MRRWVTVSFAVTSFVFVAAWAATPLPRELRVAVIDLGWLATSAIAGWACLWAARQQENAHLRTSFLFAAAASFVWAAGQVVWTFQEVVQDLDTPAFSFADAVQWFSLPLFGLAVLAWPRQRARWDLGKVLDVTLVFGFAALFGMQFVLDPLLDRDLHGLQLAFAFVYPPSEIFLFGTLVAALVLGGWYDRRRLDAMAVGLFAYVIAYAWYGFVGEEYTTGSFVDPLWVAGYAGVFVAAVSPGRRQERTGWIGERARLFAPVATLIVLAVVGIGVRFADHARVDPIELFALLGLVVLLALRQVHAQLALQAHIDRERRLEEQLEQSRKLDAVGRLAGGVAHDFNNLLTAIDGYTELALHGLAPNHPVRADLEEVRRATERASGLTRQLLVFSRRQLVAPEVVDVNMVAAAADRMLRKLAGPAVEIDLRLDTKPAYVVADAGQLEQVFTNLVVNARDAMPDGGTITIATRVTADRVALSVTDTGIGMTDEVKNKIFEPFFTTKEKGRGTGLGLAVVHGIVTQSGGELSVMTAPGRGSTFFAAFPAAEAPAAAPEDAPAPASPAGAGVVLVVEDEPTVRDIARRILELAGYVVVTAASADEAMDVFETTDIDALVTDVVMPGMRGDELARELLRRRPLPVVLMSGYSEESETLDALRAEGVAFVEKPFTSETLVAEVRNAVAAGAAV
jgi:signal transduction histidine kinase/CheY-like chemotaxis protein